MICSLEGPLHSLRRNLKQLSKIGRALYAMYVVRCYVFTFAITLLKEATIDPRPSVVKKPQPRSWIQQYPAILVPYSSDLTTNTSVMTHNESRQTGRPKSRECEIEQVHVFRCNQCQNKRIRAKNTLLCILIEW